MKPLLLVVFGMAAVSSICPAQEMVTNCDSNFQVRCTSMAFRDHIRFAKGQGRSGSAFRIFCPLDQGKRKPVSSGFQTHVQLKIESTSKPVRSRVYLKGKGKGSFGLLTYDLKRRIFYPVGVMKSFKVDSPDGWTCLEQTYTPKAGTPYANRACFLLPYISLSPGSEFLLDDWEVKFIDTDKDIVIED